MNGVIKFTRLNYIYFILLHDKKKNTRTPEEIMRDVYGCGNESIPGGFYPKGADGRIAKSHLQHC